MPRRALEALHLEEVELDRRLPAEDGDGDFDLPLLSVDLVDGAHEVGERPVGDADALAHLETDLDAWLVRLHLLDDGTHLRLVKRSGRGARADEAGYPGRV